MGRFWSFSLHLSNLITVLICTVLFPQNCTNSNCANKAPVFRGKSGVVVFASSYLLAYEAKIPIGILIHPSTFDSTSFQRLGQKFFKIFNRFEDINKQTNQNGFLPFFKVSVQMHAHQSRCVKVFFIGIFRVKLLIRIILILTITIVLRDVKFTRKPVWERSINS